MKIFSNNKFYLTQYMQILSFQVISIKRNCSIFLYYVFVQRASLFGLATFQVVDSHMWLMATTLDNIVFDSEWLDLTDPTPYIQTRPVLYLSIHMTLLFTNWFIYTLNFKFYYTIIFNWIIIDTQCDITFKCTTE